LTFGAPNRAVFFIGLTPIIAAFTDGKVHMKNNVDRTKSLDQQSARPVMIGFLSILIGHSYTNHTQSTSDLGGRLVDDPLPQSTQGNATYLSRQAGAFPFPGRASFDGEIFNRWVIVFVSIEPTFVSGLAGKVPTPHRPGNVVICGSARLHRGNTKGSWSGP
jgi:hypothetical protein